jgi:hypothetical protein
VKPGLGKTALQKLLEIRFKGKIDFRYFEHDD